MHSGGQVSPFSAAERKNPIEFPYAWRESDNVSIRLPQGFVLDNADSPGGLNFGKPGAYDIKIVVTKTAQPELIYTRTLTFGNEGTISFDSTAYPALKRDSISFKRAILIPSRSKNNKREQNKSCPAHRTSVDCVPSCRARA